VQSSRPTFIEWPEAAVAEPGSPIESARALGELELSLPGGVVLRWKA
jgi:hypothetical protein